jgi:hypothetical protein
VREGGAQLSKANDAASSERLERLMARIDAEPSRVVEPQPALRIAQTARPGIFASLFSFRWQPALAMAAAVIVVLQSGTIGYMATRDQPGGYGTLSGTGETQGAASILVQIKPDARWADLDALLAREKLHIVSGPTDGSLSLAPDSPMTSVRVEELIKRLQTSPLLIFAGAVG